MFHISRMIVKGLRLRSHYDIELHKGPQWFSITKGLAHWLVNNRKDILKTFKHVWCPDEMMVQTFTLISPFANNISSRG
ncbi:beta-1,6-N-acetylglucosaminyltransferase, partial [Bacillus pumilus]|uniref:beta-1,6-N-acetylglucosaminyltransferase n=2 Tax=Bacteria TaxID=2 RepID=UPI001C92D618